MATISDAAGGDAAGGATGLATGAGAGLAAGFGGGDPAAAGDAVAGETAAAKAAADMAKTHAVLQRSGKMAYTLIRSVSKLPRATVIASLIASVGGDALVAALAAVWRAYRHYRPPRQA